jgi:hypothetical protein
VHNGDEVGNGTTSTITPDPAESSMIETLLVPVSGSSFAGYPFTANVVCTYQSTP